jgi:hypothetical protein
MTCRPLWIALLAAGASSLVAPPAAAQPLTEFIIEPGKRAGIITEDMTEARLRKLLPKGQVKRVFRPALVERYRCGTEIFSGTENAAFVTWGSMDQLYEKETKANVRECLTWPSPSEPRSIRIERNADRPDLPSAWSLSNGIRLGMRIRQLEAVTGEPFEVLLCPCEFAGLVLNQPKSFAFRKIEILVAFPKGAHKILKDVVRPENDYAVYAADVPKEMAQDFVVSEITISLQRDYEE